jgi:hypothetical protein
MLSPESTEKGGMGGMFSKIATKENSSGVGLGALKLMKFA